VGKLGALIGKAFVVRDGQRLPAKKGMEIFSSDALVTEPKAVVKIQFTDGGNFMAFENSNVTIEEYNVKRQGDKLSLKSAFDIAQGKVRFFVKPGENRNNDSTFKTKNAVMGIRGTSGYIDARGGKTQLVVTTGKVQVSNPANLAASVMVPANHVTEVVGSSLPTAPRVAPPELLQNLRSGSDSAAASGGVEAESEAQLNEGGESDSGDGGGERGWGAGGSDGESADDAGAVVFGIDRRRWKGGEVNGD
jgi:hypothetical protein